MARSAVLLLAVLAGPHPARAAATPDTAAVAREIAGTWSGTVEHDGETQPIALFLAPGDSGRVEMRFSMPVAHLDQIPLGRPRLRLEGDSLRLGMFRLRYDREGPTLSGLMPAAFVPVYEMPLTLKKVERFDMPPRGSLAAAPPAQAVWTFDAGSALWAGPVFASGHVYAGAEDGSLYALDARTGARRWVYRAGGKIRTRPVVERDALYVQADDGYLYKLSAARGSLLWKTKIVEGAIERLPFDNPKSRYDRFGSDVLVSHDRLYVGTHGGEMLALDPGDGSVAWRFKAGDAVLAAPALVDGRIVFGSFDHNVYALDAKTGRELWRRDTRGAVVSTPAVAGDRVVVGNRAYDLFALDAKTGEPAWKRYVWMSWVESSATMRDGVAYVGSSDAAAVLAVEIATGKLVWAADVFGWSWGQPAVSDSRVYAATSSQVGYIADHAGGVLALDRGSGAVLWRYAASAPASGPYGFPGSPALGEGLVFVGGLDGKLIALKQ